jgi:hypothetical protein
VIGAEDERLKGVDTVLARALGELLEQARASATISPPHTATRANSSGFASDASMRAARPAAGTRPKYRKYTLSGDSRPKNLSRAGPSASVSARNCSVVPSRNTTSHGVFTFTV